MKIYRIHIRPKGSSVISFAYCIKQQVLGLGWQTKSQKNGVSWEEYEKEAESIYGSKDLSRVRYLRNNVRENDLIWTRDTEGNYYLGKVLSGWEYFTNVEAQDADITNVVRCNLIKVDSVDDVPGKIVASFRPSRAIQEVRDTTAVGYSKYFWNKISSTNDYKLSDEKHENIFSYINSEETEDIIFIYLQTKGWIVVPHSRKGDTMNYEFYLIHSKTKQKAIVQVKTGNTPLNPDDWSKKKEQVFLFQANGNYNGSASEGIECISPKEIENFMYTNQELMPSNISYRLDMAKHC
jgi:hypothetical protein